MNLYKRILLAFYAFVLTIASALFAVVPFKKSLLENMYAYLDQLLSGTVGAKIVVFTISLVFFVLSITFLFSGFKKDPTKTSIKSDLELGDLLVSLNAIESIAQVSMKQLRGIKESKVDVRKDGDKIDVMLKLVVYPEVIVPELSKQLQKVVKKDIEATAGVSVKKVSIKIDNVTNYSIRTNIE